MNELLQNTPFIIAAGVALILLCLWGLCAIRSRERKYKIADLVDECNNERMEKHKEIEDRICMETEADNLKKDLAFSDRNREIVENSLSLVAARAEKLEFILKNVHPQIYDDKRLDAWIKRIEEKKRRGKK